MVVKKKLLKLKQQLKMMFIPEYLQKMKELSQSEDPLSFKALNSAIDRLIEYNNQNTEKQTATIEQTISQNPDSLDNKKAKQLRIQRKNNHNNKQFRN